MVSSNQADKCLSLVIRKQLSTGDPDNLVAAGIFDGERMSIGFSEWIDDNQVVHAERNAIRKFVDEYGQPSEKAYIVTTLSPCYKYGELNKFRVGCSCADLIAGKDSLLENKISRVHVGYVDQFQNNIQVLENKGIKVSTTENKELEKTCRLLFNQIRFSLKSKIVRS